MVLVPGCGGGGKDGVPDYGFGGWFIGFGRGVNSFYVKEDLFRIPRE